jgi:hypothetical protein
MLHLRSQTGSAQPGSYLGDFAWQGCLSCSLREVEEHSSPIYTMPPVQCAHGRPAPSLLDLPQEIYNGSSSRSLQARLGWPRSEEDLVTLAQLTQSVEALCEHRHREGAFGGRQYQPKGFKCTWRNKRQPKTASRITATLETLSIPATCDLRKDHQTYIQH